MAWLAGIGLIATYFAFFFLFRALNALRRRRLTRAGGACIGSCVAAVLAGAAGSLAFSYLSYGRLVAEQHVSSIEFRRISPEEFQARLMIAGERDRFFVLRGDEWQLDARIVTWKPPMTILGLDPIFKLDRLSGRYSEIDRERHEVRTVHAIAAANPADVWALARRYPLLTPGIDAQYGTATYVPMADGARYDVSLSRDALIARPANDAATSALGEWHLPGQ